ncbi:MAG: hypothetical protein U9P42_04920 [Candidatus Fermentibacteria bacterium]|nr:hypothetical protein [Candidatus Fermentibacteria bacterium]
MWYAAAIIALVIVSTAAGMARNKKNEGTRSGTQLAETGIYSYRALSRTEINLLLSKLELTEPPEPVMGAMCYAPMALPSSTEYICPICGEKTIYDSSFASFIDWELASCRRMADNINLNTEFDVLLDESLFCDFCSQETAETPVLLLKVINEDGDEITNRITIVDLRMLESFLQGNLYYLTSNDSQRPLQDYGERMRILLGLEE